MLVGTNVCVYMVFVWEETGVPRGKPPVWLGDHMTISHADTVYWTRVRAVRDECVNTGLHNTWSYYKKFIYRYDTGKMGLLRIGLYRQVKYTDRFELEAKIT